MRIYKASGIAPLPGVFIALIAGLIVAVIMGSVLYVTRRYTGINLVILFPGLAGSVVAFVLFKAITFGKVRNGVIAALIGVIAMVAMIGTYHYSLYQFQFKDLTREVLIKTVALPTDAAVNKFSDQFLKTQTGAIGFFGFLQLQAQQGITFIADPPKVQLTGVGYWIFKAFEYGLVMLVLVIGPWMAANEPFSEVDQQYYGPEQLILTAPLANAAPIKTVLKSGAFEEAGALFQHDRTDFPRVELAVSRTATDSENLIVTASEVVQNGTGELKSKVITGLMSQLELDRLRSAVVARFEPAAR